MEKIKVFTQLTPPAPESEKVDQIDLAVLDKTSLTSVVDFMHKFAQDANFTPPTMEVMYDTDKFSVDIDSDEEFPSQYEDIESLGNNARAKN